MVALDILATAPLGIQATVVLLILVIVQVIVVMGVGIAVPAAVQLDVGSNSASYIGYNNWPSTIMRSLDRPLDGVLHT